MKPLIHKAKITFGNLFTLHIGQSAIEDQTTFELQSNLSPKVGISLPMYYNFYYQPLFRKFDRQRPASDIFSSTKMSEWIDKLHLHPGDQRDPSTEGNALFDLARNGNELVWTMATLVAGLNAFLSPEEAILVLSTAFSLCHDPRCVLPKNGTWSKTDIPSRVVLHFDNRFANPLQRPRYDLDCTLGRRLREDYFLMSQLADKCGLQKEIIRKFGYKTFGVEPEVDLTLALVALASQLDFWEVWRARSITSRPHVLLYDERLLIDPTASLVLDFLYSIQSAGISIRIKDEPDHMSPPCDPKKEYQGHDRQAWYQSREYHLLLKHNSWWPSTFVFLTWKEDSLQQQQRLPRGIHPPFIRKPLTGDPSLISSMSPVSEVPDTNPREL